MSVRFQSDVDACLSRLEQGTTSALNAAGQIAADSVRQQMLSGYARPIVDTGALLASIAYTVERNTLHVGSSLSYAEAVHDGTPFMPGRPYLQDGILISTGSMMAAVADELASFIP